MTPCARRVLAALDTMGDMPADEIAAEACVSQTYLTSGGLIRNLRAASLIRISAWRRNWMGCPTPVCSITPGDDAKRPRPYSVSEKNRRYKRRSGYRSPAWRAARALQELASGGLRK